ncbi:MAG TPA: hypothetical protein DEQ47_08985 [Solibacterales bacterium]|nr:hypothetical protein [Bryobacterales bacterium]
MWLDRWIAALLAPLAIWLLANALDDLFLDAVAAFAWFRARWLASAARIPVVAELDAVPQRRMAIFVPLWNEHGVLRRMLEHNLAYIRYRNYDFFLGVYPNDRPTLEAVEQAQALSSRVHLATCPHAGPTSKADCLNWIYQRMLLFEEQHGVRFESVLTHDAEDLVHPEALRYINYFAQNYAMVQIPVLPLPTPWSHFTHGIYCDEFSEFQYRDMPARQLLGGFIPSNGVGTGFSRDALEALAAAHSNRIFDPLSLTEDYENGLRIHQLGLPQLFIPLHLRQASMVATREYFPHSLRAAVRQRSRWVTGIALQGWQRHGWRGSARQAYWFWRDRKCLAGSLLTPVANALFLYGAGTWAWAHAAGRGWSLPNAAHHGWLGPVCAATLSLQCFHLALRCFYTSHIYGWRFGCLAPLRVPWANWINFRACATALRTFAVARWRHQPLVWLKTEHSYPHRAALDPDYRRLGEILVGSSYLSAAALEQALATRTEGVRLGAYLVAIGGLSEQHLYEALALQQKLPLGCPGEVAVAVTRAIPAEVARKWTVLPFRVAAGELYLAGTDIPTPPMTREIQQFCPLQIRFHLVTPTDYHELASAYLPSE